VHAAAVTVAERVDRWLGVRATSRVPAHDHLLQAAAVLVAVVAAASVLLPGLGATSLVDWDESIYAAVARAVHEGSTVHLEWNGDPYDRKPPLLFWLIAASYRVLGVSELATRLPSALAGVATVAVVALVVARRAGVLAALLGTSFLLGSTLFVERGGRRACTDALLLLFSVVAMALATAPRAARRNTLLAGVAVGLAILSKGAAGMVVPAALLVGSPFDTSRRRLALRIAALGAAVALPWYALQVWFRGSAFLASHVGHELVQRALRPIHGIGAPWSYPLTVLWESAGPWVAVVVLVVLLRCLTDRDARRDVLPWASGAGIVLVAAMSMQTKLPWYPLPALPMLAVAAGLCVGGARSAPAISLQRTIVVLLVVAASGALLSSAQARRTVLEDELQFEPFRELGGRIAATLADEPFIGATSEHPTLVFYGGRPMRVYARDELSRLLRDPGELPRAALVDEGEAPALLDLGAEEVARFGDRVLVRYAPLEG
jgi:4-amino-4-deoxy-L-arabinose transferase-like glycosyltransferase